MGTSKPRHFRIFIASPGDVTHERELSLKVLDRLPYEPSFRGHITIEEVAWDKKGAGAPILANMTPQDSIQKGLPRPSECDIVVVIFWSRMGTPLPSQYVKKNGDRYHSGTEWEYEDAIEANELTGRPEVLLYRRTGPVLLNPEDLEFEVQTKQYRLVKAFFDALANTDGSINRGHNPYENPAEFGELLEFHLKSVIERLLREPRVTDAFEEIALPPAWPKSPFPGLRAFTAEDAPIFFGRERETDALVKRVEEKRVVAVVGASGSGKSSLVGAGLIPRLLLTSGNEGWRSVWTTPDYLGSGDPFAALAASLLRDLPGVPASQLAVSLSKDQDFLARSCLDALASTSNDAKVLLFLDQFEELFTTVIPTYRQPFIDMIVKTANYERIRVVITLRGDFYGKCVEIPKLAKLLEESTYPLSVPGLGSLYEMIKRPASRADLKFEEGLAQQILDDTGDEPGSLPLMAYTLDELYRSSKKTKRLTRDAYKELGGVQGAIGKRSEGVFMLLDPNEQAALPHVFRELVEVDERGTATRKRESFASVARTGEASSLVWAFTNARLLVMSSGENNQPYVEVAHEALLRSWERLADWIKSTQDDLRLLRQVRIAAQDWDRNGRRDDFLWSQERLEPVYIMRDRLEIDFDPTVLDFVRPEVDRLLDEFKSHHQYFRQRPIIERFAEIGKNAVSSLVKALPYARIKSSRRDIHNVLLKYRDQSMPLLKRDAHSGEVGIRRAVTEELGKMCEATTIKELIRLLADADSQVRLNAAIAVGNLGNNSAIPPLSKLLDDPDVAVRQVASIELASFGNEEALDCLLGVLVKPMSEIRPLCAYLLGRIGSEKPEKRYPYEHFAIFSELHLRFYDLYDLLGDAITKSDGKLANRTATSKASRVLIQCLGDEDPDLRQRAATSLGLLADSGSVKGLGKLLRDDEDKVREAAMGALSRIADESLLPILTNALSGTNRNVRAWAAERLGILGDKSIQNEDDKVNKLRDLIEVSDIPEALLAALKDLDVRVQENAARALGRIGNTKASGALSHLLRNKNPALRGNAAEALGMLGAKSAVPALVEILNDSDIQARVSAVRALGRLGGSVVPDLIELMQGGDHQANQYALKLALIEVLGELGNDAVVPVIKEALRNNDSRISRAALSSLKRINTAAARKAMIDSGYFVPHPVTPNN